MLLKQLKSISNNRKLITRSNPSTLFYSTRSSSENLEFSQHSFLSKLDLSPSNPGTFNGSWFSNGSTIQSTNPSTNKPISNITCTSPEDYESILSSMDDATKSWRSLPLPKRGDIVRDIGQALREKLDPLGRLISLEMGKIVPEGIGEVQEVIDMCDYATGLSRSLAGQVIPSERPDHRILEVWNPLGHVGIITAFNFPMAVYGWNICLSLIAGNVNLWKPSPSTPLSAIAMTKVMAEVLEEHKVPKAVISLAIGDSDIGDKMINDDRFPLISFTGSVEVGQHVSKVVNARFGRALLELSGNNALIVLKDADMELAVRSTLFAAVGTCGQRCTTTRRLYLQKEIKEEFVSKLVNAYKTVQIGDPLKEGTLCGPLHTKKQVEDFEAAIKKAKEEGGKVLVGGDRRQGEGNYVNPTIIEVPSDASVIQNETFAPILYVMEVDGLEEAIELNNGVKQGLSSSLFTSDIQSMFKWIGPNGSDCGIVNVNIPTSGAEIGGAFGGNKATGWGREAGSDSWKQYMRRSTITINHSSTLPLAQGINFG